MKILRLRFSNLHSLRGTHEIDFAHGPLADSGIFAITGPTGAGKTTILDAMTLALFGQVARYGDARNPDSVMSRQTGECWAEVEFECSGGSAYRCRWSRKRARGSAGGNLQPAERSVHSLTEEKSLTRGVREADEKVEELTGLDLNRFVRSVLLAQGDFAQFLTADSKEQTALLAKITGTPDYTRISQAAFEAARAAREALRDAEFQCGALTVLSDADRDARKAELEARRADLAAAKVACESLESRIKIGETARDLAREGAGLAEQKAALLREVDALFPQTVALTVHRRIAGYRAELDEHRRLANLGMAQAESLRQAEERLPGLEEMALRAREAAAAALEALRALEDERDRLQPLWQKVGELDARIGAKNGETTAAEAALAKARTAEGEAQQAAQEERDRLTRAEAAAQSIQQWLAEHSGDAALREALPPLQGLLAAWKERGKSARDAGDRLKSARADAEAQARSVAALRIPLAAALTEAEAADQAVLEANGTFAILSHGRPVEDWQAEADETQRSLMRWRELSDLRLTVAADVRQAAEATQQMQELEGRTGAIDGELPRRKEAVETTTELLESYRQAEHAARLVQSLEKHRAELKSGEPCPLCGGTEHPFSSPDRARSFDTGDAMARTRDAEKRLRAAIAAMNALCEERAQVVAQRDLLRRQEEGLSHERNVRQCRWQAACRAEELAADGSGELFSARLAEVSERARMTAEKMVALRRDLELCRKGRDRQAQAQLQLENRRSAVETAEAVLAQKREIATQAVEADARMTEQCDAAAKSARAAFATHGAAPQDPAEAEAALKALGNRLAAHERQREALNEASTVEKTARVSLRERESALSAASAQAKAQESLVATLTAEAEGLKAERWALFGGRNVADDVAGMKHRSTEQTGRAESARQRSDEAAAAVRQTGESVLRLRRERETTDAALIEVQTVLEKAAKDEGFGSIERLEAAILPEAEARAAEEREKALFAKRQSLDDAQRRHDERLAALPPEAADWRDSLGRLGEELALARVRRDEWLVMTGGLAQALQADDDARTRRSAMTAQIDAARRESGRWEALSALIGSADGQKKFAPFAQSLTLDRLIALANGHLHTLNPRYSIRRDTADDQKLEMEIVDHYQADAVRPMASLSGGETFLVSLALALGLSALASGVSRLDSLFIDEGFGSLDGETLDTALDTLEKLRATGKSIGLISHVESIKERIPAQIRVLKKAGGVSSLEIVG